MDNIHNIFNNLDSKLKDASRSEEINVLYINNPDGSVRWIWPLKSKQPLFLKFYHVQGLKANLFAFIIPFIFRAGLQKFIFKSTKIKTVNPYILDAYNWALFTGTTGPNQKYILYQKNAVKGGGYFTKIGITFQSQSLINHEKSVIDSLSKKQNIYFDFPVVLHSDEHTVTFLENSSFNKRVNTWSCQHTFFIHSLKELSPNKYSFADFDLIHQLSNRIKYLKYTSQKLPSGIIKKLELLRQNLMNCSVHTHRSHGDFTPWNTWSDDKGRLLVYDWELANENYPLGFDFFHFIIQNGVLTQKKSWHKLSDEISHLSSNIFKDGNYETYLSLYLLIHVLNYLEIYENQKVWHEQIHWLLETWNLALSEVLQSKVNQRELVILDTFDHLHFSDYSGLKLSDQVEKVSEYSDIDLLMEKKTSKTLVQFLENHPLIKKIHLQTGAAMSKIMMLTRDNQLLSMDHIFQLRRKSLEYMNVSELIKRPNKDSAGIKRMNVLDMQQFIGLFYGLNNAAIPEKYRKYKYAFSSENERLHQIIHQQFTTGIPYQKELYNELNKLKVNQGISGLKNKIYYLVDTIKNAIEPKGLVITFSGVDGSGKSTVIENTKKEIEKKMRRRVTVIRHRPSLLPILSAWTKGKIEAEKEACEKLPRQGQNKSLLSSIFRFMYYYIDYFFGQFYIYCKYVCRGYIVLYDRYYFDFINDSLRSNITLPKWILKSGYNLLIKPDLNFFLYADANTILSRKKELNESTINTLTGDYLGLFKKLGRGKIDQYQAIENIHLEHTINHISIIIQSKLI